MGWIAPGKFDSASATFDNCWFEEGYLTLADGSKISDDQVFNSATKVISDSILAGDEKSDTGKVIQDGVNVSDTPEKGITRSFSEGVKGSDAAVKGVTKPLTDGAEGSDTEVTTPTKVISDGAKISDTIGSWALTKVIATGAKISDVAAKIRSLALSDGVIAATEFLPLGIYADIVHIVETAIQATCRWGRPDDGTWIGPVKWVRDLLTWTGLWGDAEAPTTTWTSAASVDTTWLEATAVDSAWTDAASVDTTWTSTEVVSGSMLGWGHMYWGHFPWGHGQWLIPEEPWDRYPDISTAWTTPGSVSTTFTGVASVYTAWTDAPAVATSWSKESSVATPWTTR